MKALILAAGLGIRMGSITSDKPKALIEVEKINLIDRVLGFLDHPKITQIGVVGGCNYDNLKEHLKWKDVQLFFNPAYRHGNILSLKAALDFINDDLLLANVDHIYPKELLTHILNNASKITAMCDFDRVLGEDDMKVKLADNGRMKKISKQLEDYDGGYIGMTFCSKEMISIYKEAVHDTENIYGKDSCVEFVLGHLAANDVEVNICDTSGYRWYEIDTPEDLLNTEEILGKGMKAQ